MYDNNDMVDFEECSKLPSTIEMFLAWADVYWPDERVNESAIHQ